MAVLKYKNKNGEYVSLTNYTISPLNPLQTTGDSATDVMSQFAVTKALSRKADVSDLFELSESLQIAKNIQPLMLSLNCDDGMTHEITFTITNIKSISNLGLEL